MSTIEPAGTQPESSEDTPRQSMLFIIASLMAAATFLMLTVGGEVTTNNAGDVDPTWNWFRFWEWFRTDISGNKLLELGHRMIGVILGFVMIYFVIAVFINKHTGRALRIFSVITLADLILQGIMGGFRVRVSNDPNVQQWLVDNLNVENTNTAFMWLSRHLAMTHAINGQLLFSMMVTLALITSAGWKLKLQAHPSPLAGRMRRMAIISTGLVIVQLTLGAIVRHWPADKLSERGGMVMVHILVAITVLGHIFALSSRARKHHEPVFPVRQPTALLGFLVIVQVFLGFGAWMITRVDASPPPPLFVDLIVTGHQATGAMILAICTVVTLRSFRLIEPQTPDAGGETSTMPAEPST